MGRALCIERAIPGWRAFLALDVRELFADEIVADLEDVDAADMAVRPVVAPELDDAIAELENFLDVEDRCVVGEDRFPRDADRGVAFAANAIGCRTRCIKHTIGAGHSHRRVEVMR